MQIAARGSLIAALTVLLARTPGAVAADTLPDGFYRYPTIGGGAIVFTAEDDLWKVPVTGGVALYSYRARDMGTGARSQFAFGVNYYF